MIRKFGRKLTLEGFYGSQLKVGTKYPYISVVFLSSEIKDHYFPNTEITAYIVGR